MAQKDSPDIPDIPLDDSAAGNREEIHLDTGTGGAKDTSRDFLRRVINRINSWVFINKIIVLSIFGGLILLAFVAGIWMILPGKGPANKQGGSIQPPAASSEQYNGVRMDGFVVDVKDDSGNIRVLVCDLVLEPIHGGTLNGIESRMDIRQSIYRILQAREIGLLLAPDGRSALKKEIKAEIVRLFGEGRVKDVYFIKYTVL